MRRPFLFVCGLALILTSIGLAPSASAARNWIAHWSVKQSTTCVNARPSLTVVTTQPSSIGFGYPQSDTIFWIKREVPAGTYTIPLKRQRFDTTKRWVGVVSLLDDSSKLQVSRKFTFNRAAQSYCQPAGTSKHTWDGSHGRRINKSCDYKLFLWTLRGVRGDFGPLVVKHRHQFVQLDSGWRARPGVVKYFDYVDPTTKLALHHPKLTQAWVKGSNVRWNVRRVCGQPMEFMDL